MFGNVSVFGGKTAKPAMTVCRRVERAVYTGFSAQAQGAFKALI